MNHLRNCKMPDLTEKTPKIHIDHNYWNASKKLFIPRHVYVHTLVLTI